MNIRNFLTLCCLGLLLSTFGGCSSPPEKTAKPSAPEKETQWDYQKIRDSREALQKQEEARPPKSPEDDITFNCVILNETQKKRAGASGCRPLKPNEGYGENMFCCERD